jgi:hypothetical protein
MAEHPWKNSCPEFNRQPRRLAAIARWAKKLQVAYEVGAAPANWDDVVNLETGARKS